MNAKERFNSMIKEIERDAENGQMTARAIAQKLCDINFLEYRVLSAIFMYLTGFSLLEYIKERKMMSAYKMLISCPLLNIEAAIVVSGYDNQSSFSKKFKEQFGITPTDAYQTKDERGLTAPIDWDSLSSEAGRFFEESIREDRLHRTKFGVTLEQYKRMNEAANLQEMFELDDEQSEIAFKLAEYLKTDLQIAFEFVKDISDYYCVDDEGNYVGESPVLWSIIKNNQTLTELYVKKMEGKCSILSCIDMIDQANALKINILKIDSEYLQIYMNHEWSFRFFVSAVALFIKYNGVEFEDFAEKLDMGYSPEDAVNEDDDINIEDIFFESPEEVEAMLEFEKWAEEQTDYENAEIIDLDYYEDYPYYDDNDYGADAWADESDGY